MKKESRRTVPISAITLAAVMVLLAFEGLVIGGVFELRASTIARVAPWAYEPFLRLVGEHPDAYRHRQGAGTNAKPLQTGAAAASAGLDADTLIREAAQQTAASTSQAPEEAVSETAEEEAPETDLPKVSSDDEMPVG